MKLVARNGEHKSYSNLVITPDGAFRRPLRIDCHRHLGGSITPQFVWQLIQEHRWHYLAETCEQVVQQMTFAPQEPAGFHRFLHKFRILDQIEWTEELIARSIQDVCQELIRDRIDYTMLRFSVNKYMGGKLNWHRHQAISFIHDCFQQYAPGRVGLMLSLKYESPQASQQQYARLVSDHRVVDRLIGLDLVGDEMFFNAQFYAPIFRDWKQAGKICCAHVAESQGADNARAAIEQLQCDELAHGIHAWGHQDILQLARDRQVCFAMALRSNYLTGVWTHQDWHPIRMVYNQGLAVTIGTDDPVQCGTSYDQEFQLLGRLGFSLAEQTVVATGAEQRCRRYGLLPPAQPLTPDSQQLLTRPS